MANKSSTEAQVQVIGGPGEESRGTAQVYRRPLAPKLFIAFISFILCTAFAVCAIAIPVLHFFLVPGLFLLGIGLAARTMMLSSSVQSSDVRCPVCSADLSLPKQFFKSSTYVECSGCRRRLFVELDPR